MVLLRSLLAVIKHDQPEQIDLFVREPSQRRIAHDVARMSVPIRIADLATDAVYQRRELQQFPLVRAEAVDLAGLIEQLERETRNVMFTRVVALVFAGQLDDAPSSRIGDRSVSRRRAAVTFEVIPDD